MRLAYIVSRFPHASETFIVRELEAVSAAEGVSIELLSLFPPVDATVHAAARPWLERLRRPRAWAALRALAWWGMRRPLRLLSSCAIVVRENARSPSRLARSLVTVPIAAAHARDLGREADHVHAHYATYPALAAWTVHRLTGLPYSFTAHAHDLYVDQAMLRRKVLDARFVVTISDYNRRFLEPFADGRTPVHLVRCGVDPALYPYRPREIPGEGPVRALCVASLQEYKGHRYLIDALAGSGPLGRVRLDLVGDGPLRAELERRCERVGIAGRVRFHGSAPEERVRELQAIAELFVLPSVVARDGQMEGLPLVLVEALASGATVVATRISGVPELVADGETGLLAAPADVDALREALERVVGGGFRPDRAAARRLVERDFDVRRSAERLRELFAAAIAASPELEHPSSSAPGV